LRSVSFLSVPGHQGEVEESPEVESGIQPVRAPRNLLVSRMKRRVGDKQVSRDSAPSGPGRARDRPTVSNTPSPQLTLRRPNRAIAAVDQEYGAAVSGVQSGMDEVVAAVSQMYHTQSPRSSSVSNWTITDQHTPVVEVTSPPTLSPVCELTERSPSVLAEFGRAVHRVVLLRPPRKRSARTC